MTALKSPPKTDGSWYIISQSPAGYVMYSPMDANSGYEIEYVYSENGDVRLRSRFVLHVYSAWKSHSEHG